LLFYAKDLVEWAKLTLDEQLVTKRHISDSTDSTDQDVVSIGKRETEPVGASFAGSCGTRVEQIGAPLDLYDRPGNLFVAGFIGSPAMNFFRGAIRHNGKAEFVGQGGISLPLGEARQAAGAADGRHIVYGIRPEHFTLADDGVDAEIRVVEPTGSETQLVAKLGGEEMLAVFRERHAFKPGDRVRLKPDLRLVHLFDEATGKRLDG
jgi:multiple sugar transport system ATP-binding protein